MDARTAKLALEEIRHIEATLDRVQKDVRETRVIMDRIIAKTRCAPEGFARAADAIPNRI
jgi:hypothetical protein